MVSTSFDMLEPEAAKVCSDNLGPSRGRRQRAVGILSYMLPAGKYLSYREWGKDPSGRVRFQSAKAQRPMRWHVVNLENNTFSRGGTFTSYGVS